MSWLFSLALVAEYSAASCSDGAPSAPSNSTSTPAMFLSHGKTTDASALSRYGMMCEPLTEDRGVAVLTWYLEGFPVRTSQALETEKVLTVNGLDFGGKWRESLMKCDPVLRSWKTHRCLWEEVLPKSCVTLPQSGMTLGGVLWEHITPADPTAENGFGLWPTPRCTEAEMKPRVATQDLLNGIRSHGWDLCEAVYDAAMTHHREWPGMVEPGEIMADGMPSPSWWEWLMGWPIGWTDVTRSAMDRFQQWQQWHSTSYAEDLA